METNARIQSKQQKARVISLISGKGGVGKTAVCGSLGLLLSKLGYSVLLVDADLATHGLTYFFIDDVQRSRATDLLEIAALGVAEIDIPDYQKALEDSVPVYTSQGLRLVPSISEFSDGEVWPTEDEVSTVALSSTIRDVLEAVIEKYRQSANFIILDAQAGAVPAAKACIELSDIVVTVMEADPIGMWAVRTLERQFAKAYSPRTQTYYLANKLFFEEVAQYKALTDYLRAFSHLPPLPFDFEVRKAFARRTIPIQFDQPTAFLFAMIRLVRDLIPAAGTRIRNLEQELSQKTIGPIKEEIEVLTKNIEEMQQQVEIAERRSRRLRTRGLVLALYVVTLLFAFPWALERIAIIDISTQKIVQLGATLTIAFLFALLIDLEKLYSALQRMLGYKPVERESKDVLLRELDDLMARRRSLETLILTRREELLFETKGPNSPPSSVEAHE